jgi:hypothetical protein
MAGYLSNLFGTLKTTFQLGKGGPKLKNNAGVVEARNAADTDYVALRALLVSIFGQDLVLNAGAAGAGDDWTLTISRADTGQTENLQIVWPGPSPANGQVLAVDSIAAGVVTLEWVSVAAGGDNVKVDTTALEFDSASPVAMFTLAADGIAQDISVIIDTPFDGAPSLSIGVTGTLSKFMASTEVDLTDAAGTIYHVKVAVPPEGGNQDLIATYAAGGATVGAARILTNYVPDAS